MSYFEFKTYSGKYLLSQTFDSFKYAESTFGNIEEKTWFSEFNFVKFWFGFSNYQVNITSVYEMQLTEEGDWDWSKLHNGLNGLLDIQHAVNEADNYSNVGKLTIGDNIYEPAVLDDLNYFLEGKNLHDSIFYVKLQIKFLILGPSYQNGAVLSPITTVETWQGSLVEV